MTQNQFSDLNPYEAPVVMAELVPIVRPRAGRPWYSVHMANVFGAVLAIVGIIAAFQWIGAQIGR